MKLNPNDIVIGDRIREKFDPEKLKDLISSIREIGQIQPSIIDSDKNLITGHRRLLACQALEIDLWVEFKDNLSRENTQLMELHENIHREDLTPQEIALAMKKYHLLLEEQAKEKGSVWTARNTADVMNVGKSTVYNALEAADSIEEDPELFKDCETMFEIKKKIKRKEVKKEQDVRVLLFEAKKLQEGVKEKEIFFHGDGLTWLQGQKENSANLVFFDPPWGVNLGTKRDDVSFDDTPATFIDYFPVWIEAIEKVMAENSWFVLTYAISTHCFVLKIIEELFKGARVIKKPVIVKKEGIMSGRHGNTEPLATYEPCLLVRKGMRELNERMPDCTTIPWSRSIFHPTEKPLGFYNFFLKHLAKEGDRIIDPCFGSGSSLIASSLFSDKFSVAGCELDGDYIKYAKVRMEEAKNGME